MDHPGRLVTQDELLEAIWPDTYVQPEVLRKYILELRKILGDRPKDPLFIETIPKRGYQFVAPVTETGAGRADSEPRSALLAGPDSAPVGRLNELEQLHDYFRSAVRGQRRVIFVTGECGAGKTTLIDAFERSIAAPGIQIARGQCAEGYGGQEAYYPVLEALGQLIRSSAFQKVIQVLTSTAPTWLIQFPHLLKPDQREELQREIMGATRERMVRELCEAVETLTADTPLVLILEDLHWVDNSTLDVISALARRRATAKLLLLATYRPVDVILRQSSLKALKQDLGIHRLCFDISLERLTEDSVREYLTGEFPNSVLPESLATLVHNRSDGNPLFMAALTEEMVAKGVVEQRDGSWQLVTPVEEIELGVPDTLQQMIELQVDQLNDAEQRVLKAASVAGQRFSAWSVSAALNEETAPIEEICEKFTHRGQFLRRGRGAAPIGSGLSANYEFRHSLYREALYRRLPPTQKATMHSHLAEAAQTLLGAEGEREFATKLAHHFEHARRIQPAVRYLLLAAANAGVKYAHRESIALLERALRLLGSEPTDAGRQTEIEVLEAISDAHYALGEMERSARIDERAATLAGERGMKIAQVNALTRSARALAFLDPDDCVIVCERAAEICASIDEPLLQARSELLAACWRIVTSGWTQSDADLCAEAREKITRFHAPGLAAYQEILYAHVQSLQGEYIDSCRIADAGLLRANEIHSLVMYLSCLSSKALALIHLGWWGELRRVLTHGLDLARKNGNAPWAGIFGAMLAWLHMQSCDFDGARRLAKELVNEQVEEPMGQAQCIALLTVGFCDLATGHAQRAMGPLVRVRDRQAKPRVFLQWYWRMISKFALIGAWLELGDLDEAQAESQIFLEEMQTTADPALRAPAWDAVARVAAARGELSYSLECSDNAVAEMRGFDLPSVAWRVHSTASLLHSKAGHPEEAAAHLEKSTAALRMVAASFEQDDSLRASLLAAASGLEAKLQHELEHARVSGAPDRAETR